VPLYVLLLERQRIKNSIIMSGTIVAVYSFIRFYLLDFTDFSGHTVPISKVDFVTRLMTYPKSAFYYLKTFFWPDSLLLNQNWVIHQVTFTDVTLPLIFQILTLLFFIWFIYVSSSYIKKYLIFFLTVLILNIGLHSNIAVPLDATVADRWFYVGSFGIIGFFSLLINLFCKQGNRYLKAVSVLGLLIITACGLRSFERSKDWESSLTLFTKEFEKDPNDYSFANSLGLVHLKAGDWNKAEKYFRKSVVLDPSAFANWNNLGTVEERRGRLAEAETCYGHAINNGQYPPAIENYVHLLMKQNRIEEVRSVVNEALLFLPQNIVLLEIKKSLPER
jgi:tetratricopeptide (TPR) repeat protein